MRRLQDFQTVTLNIGDLRTTATVASVDRGVAQLEVPEGRLLANIALPAPVELGFVHQGRAVSLSGTLARDGYRWLTFMPQAPGQVPSRRTGARRQLHLAVRVTIPSGATVHTSSMDLSASGVLLAHSRLGRPLDRLGIVLTLPGTLGTVETDARIVRIGWNETALRFSGTCDEDLAKIKVLVEDVRYTLAQRLSAQRQAG